MVKIKIVGTPHLARFKDGDIGYIDGYVRGANNEPLCVVVCGKDIDFVSIYNLEVIE
jgi:hypothetical protein